MYTTNTFTKIDGTWYCKATKGGFIECVREAKHNLWSNEAVVIRPNGTACCWVRGGQVTFVKGR